MTKFSLWAQRWATAIHTTGRTIGSTFYSSSSHSSCGGGGGEQRRCAQAQQQPAPLPPLPGPVPGGHQRNKGLKHLRMDVRKSGRRGGTWDKQRYSLKIKRSTETPGSEPPAGRRFGYGQLLKLPNIPMTTKSPCWQVWYTKPQCLVLRTQSTEFWQQAALSAKYYRSRTTDRTLDPATQATGTPTATSAGAFSMHVERFSFINENLRDTVIPKERSLMSLWKYKPAAFTTKKKRRKKKKLPGALSPQLLSELKSRWRFPSSSSSANCNRLTVLTCYFTYIGKQVKIKAEVS